MKRINNKGFAISTFLYSLIVMIFLIVLASLSMLGTSRNNTKNLTDDLKKDLIDRYDGKKPVCRRVTTNDEDHMIIDKCSGKEGSCYGAFCYCCRHDPSKYGGYTENASITYGRIATPGTLTPGDAFICDVDGNGNYNEDTFCGKKNGRDHCPRETLEMFYYLGPLDSNPEYAVLIFFANVKGGKMVTSTNESGFDYSSTTDALTGPTTAVNQLPTISQWKNVRLYKENRTITDKDGNKPFDYAYTGRAARLPTYKELARACPQIATYRPGGTTDLGTAKGNCEYLMLYTPYDSGRDDTKTKGYWTETVASETDNTTKNKHIIVDGMARNMYPLVNNRIEKEGKRDVTRRIGVRPVIEVPLHLIDYQ